MSDDQKHYIATLTNAESRLEILADTHSDWLPDYFFNQFESIPGVFQSNKKFYQINPAIGLTGQEACYFCGTEPNLKQARKKGLRSFFQQRTT